MKNSQNSYRFIDGFIALIWLVNGLFCKVLNLVPRHAEIVSKILGERHAAIITVGIGFTEIGMAFWIWSGYYKKWNTFTQTLIILSMNLLEYFLAKDLLLFGGVNFLLALMLIITINVNSYKSPLYNV